MIPRRLSLTSQNGIAFLVPQNSTSCDLFSDKKDEIKGIYGQLNCSHSTLVAKFRGSPIAGRTNRMNFGENRPTSLALCLAAVSFVLVVGRISAQQPKALPGSGPCLDCHDPGRRTGKREAGVPPPFNEAALRASPHATLG